MGKSIGYHTRLDSDNTKKICGGSFQGQMDQATIERLTKSQFTAVVKNSGRVVFVDGRLREVALYVSVDASETSIGKAAMSAHQDAINKRDYEEANKDRRLTALLDSMSTDAAIKLLSGDI